MTTTMGTSEPVRLTEQEGHRASCVVRAIVDLDGERVVVAGCGTGVYSE